MLEGGIDDASDGKPSDGARPSEPVTDSMQREELKLQRQSEKEHTKEIRKKGKSEFSSLMDDNRMKRLNFLINQSKVYTSILTEKLRAQQKRRENKPFDSLGEDWQENSSDQENEAKGEETSRRISARHKNSQNGSPASQPPKKKRVMSQNNKTDSNYELKDYIDVNDLSQKSQHMSAKEALQAAQQENRQIGTGFSTKTKPSAAARQPALVTGAIMRDYQLAGLEWLVSL